MYTTSCFRNLGTESCFRRRVAAYRFKAEGHVTVFVREILYKTHLTVIIRLWKSYVVTHPKRFVYCKLGVAEIKSERPPAPFGLAS